MHENYFKDEGSLTAELKIDRKTMMKLNWIIAKDFLHIGFRLLWEIVVLFFRKDGDG